MESSSKLTRLPFVAAGRDFARRVYHELKLHNVRRRQPKRRPSVVIFPSRDAWLSSSNLRAWLVEPELQRLGWRTVIVPQALNLSQRRRVLHLEKPDVILLQQTQHPLNRPAFYRPYPCVLDADDADYLDPRYQALIAQCAKDAGAVVGGSRLTAQLLGQHNARPAHVLWTCTPRPSGAPKIVPRDREPIVGWAHDTPLEYPHEAQLMQQVMMEVCRRTRCTFWLFGTKEEAAGEYFAPIRALGGKCVAIERMPYEAYLAKVAETAVGLQPIAVQNDFSRGKSFGKILAYLAGQVAVVASDAVDHPLFFTQGKNGYLVGDVVQEWADAIVPLLDQPDLRQRVAIAGWNDFHETFTTDIFARRMDQILRSVAALPPAPQVEYSPAVAAEQD